MRVRRNNDSPRYHVMTKYFVLCFLIVTSSGQDCSAPSEAEVPPIVTQLSQSSLKVSWDQLWPSLGTGCLSKVEVILNGKLEASIEKDVNLSTREHILEGLTSCEELRVEVRGHLKAVPGNETDVEDTDYDDDVSDKSDDTSENTPDTITSSVWVGKLYMPPSPNFSAKDQVSGEFVGTRHFAVRLPSLSDLLNSHECHAVDPISSTLVIRPKGSKEWKETGATLNFQVESKNASSELKDPEHNNDDAEEESAEKSRPNAMIDLSESTSKCSVHEVALRLRPVIDLFDVIEMPLVEIDPSKMSPINQVIFVIWLKLNIETVED